MRKALKQAARKRKGSSSMKKYAALILVLAVASTAFAPAQAADDSPIKKVGNAIVWPFKKMGQGLKAMGNGAKKIVKRGN